MMPEINALWRFPLVPGREEGNGAARQPFPQTVDPALTDGGQGQRTRIGHRLGCGTR